MKRAALLLVSALCACTATPTTPRDAQGAETTSPADVSSIDVQSAGDVLATDAAIADVAAPDVAPPVDAAPCLPMGNATNGATVAANTRGANCVGCHGANLGGGTNRREPPGANLHNDGTGAGGWSDCDFQRAVRTGVDDEGATLCPDMPVYSTRSLTDQQLADIFAYMQTLTTPGIDPGACQ